MPWNFCLKKSKIPKGWPEPLIQNKFTDVDNINIQFIKPFNNSTNCLYFTFDKTDILLIYNYEPLQDSILKSKFKEKFDIIIINSIFPLIAVTLRT